MLLIGGVEMTNYTHAEKQQALNEAHLIMNPEERLVEINKYVNDSLRKHVNPYLNEEDLRFLIRMAYKGCRND